MSERTEKYNVDNPIICDTREPDKIVGLVRTQGVEATWETLKVGDYKFFDRDGGLVLVSRKGSDLLTSIFDDHLQDEFSRCITAVREHGSGSVWYLQEGVWRQKGGAATYFTVAGDLWFKARHTFHRVEPSTVISTQMSLQAAGIQMVFTSCLEDTAIALERLYHRAQKGWPSSLTEPSPRPQLKWSRDKKVRHLMGLWPRLDETTAIAILSRMGSIESIIYDATSHTGGERLLTIKGVGKTRLNNLLEVLQ